MKFSIALGLASAIAMAAVSPAQASQNCGAGFHRAPNGLCRPNPGQQQAYVVGRFYAGHGYWNNNRWYQHRARWHSGWRYH